MPFRLEAYLRLSVSLIYFGSCLAKQRQIISLFNPDIYILRLVALILISTIPFARLLLPHTTYLAGNLPLLMNSQTEEPSHEEARLSSSGKACMFKTLSLSRSEREVIIQMAGLTPVEFHWCMHLRYPWEKNKGVNKRKSSTTLCLSFFFFNFFFFLNFEISALFFFCCLADPRRSQIIRACVAYCLVDACSRAYRHWRLTACPPVGLCACLSQAFIKSSRSVQFSRMTEKIRRFIDMEWVWLVFISSRFCWVEWRQSTLCLSFCRYSRPRQPKPQPDSAHSSCMTTFCLVRTWFSWLRN